MIKKNLERIPGGMMVVPLLLAAVINTFFPELLRIGGFTQALFVDSVPVLAALYLLTAGAQLNVRSFGVSVAKGATLLGIKWFVAGVFTFLAYFLAGPTGLWLGLAPLAVMAAMSNSNGIVYMAVASQYGNKEDKAAYSVLVLNDGPLLTMVALSIFGAMGFVEGMFSATAFITVLLPLVIGVIIGNTDMELRDMLVKGSDIIIPFLSFALGMGINLTDVVKGGSSGILLGVATVVFTGGAAYLVFKALGWNPIVGAAEGTTAGNAVMVPGVIAAANASFLSVAPLATVQVAASAVTTAILIPIVLALLVKYTKVEGESIALEDQETVHQINSAISENKEFAFAGKIADMDVSKVSTESYDKGSPLRK
ncbi:2-keto-3-deoxygluconate permease [Sporosarcina sp. P26b]|uniref:2-keto-3-deoxygluconate permease n=1 Tax=unclassified Sporosarcina TaxID=2647733 RepID=UPI000C16681B|nr:MULTISPECIES: 2-keto-3-deoxygluconate permease [unclassified Sporosarcina]PIC96353.1 2-keto-3-deoxygluconate permease [Sporosarcina sp. P26b]PIC98586.1 2-keto-3-deoxygluconate permease [Sporosarcina sp. P29]PID06013.1 2-keto-3-deoxygluconate permease [Sporosarcina sp. P30]PID09207.1 2-keto-3-deoxygluconate permease [Sporosarcina sp. P31]PID12505.1 2-keto-3-deoxygluconate permease [Sporosarcina sp. P32b]